MPDKNSEQPTAKIYDVSRGKSKVVRIRKTKWDLLEEYIDRELLGLDAKLAGVSPTTKNMYEQFDRGIREALYSLRQRVQEMKKG